MISTSFEKFANGILFTFTLPERETHIDDNTNLLTKLESENRITKLFLFMSFILFVISIAAFSAVCHKNTEEISKIGKINFGHSRLSFDKYFTNPF